MKDTKPFYASLGVMGPLTGLMVYVINNWVGGGFTVDESQIEQIINLVSTLWAALTGMYGRWRATSQIGSRA